MSMHWQEEEFHHNLHYTANLIAGLKFAGFDPELGEVWVGSEAQRERAEEIARNMLDSYE